MSSTQQQKDKLLRKTKEESLRTLDSSEIVPPIALGEYTFVFNGTAYEYRQVGTNSKVELEG